MLYAAAIKYEAKVSFTAPCRKVVNSLRPSDAIWRHRSGSTLAQVMACCLTAPSHYLNQCWLIISKIQWYSSEGNVTRDILATNHICWLENYLSKISIKSPRGQWVNSLVPGKVTILTHWGLDTSYFTNIFKYTFSWTKLLYWISNITTTSLLLMVQITIKFSMS